MRILNWIYSSKKPQDTLPSIQMCLPTSVGIHIYINIYIYPYIATQNGRHLRTYMGSSFLRNAQKCNWVERRAKGRAPGRKAIKMAAKRRWLVPGSPAQVKNYSVKFIFDDFLIAKPKTVAPPPSQSEPQSQPQILPLAPDSHSHIMLAKVLSMASLSSVLAAIAIIIIIIVIIVYIHLHLNCTLYMYVLDVLADPKQCQSFGIKLQVALNWMDGWLDGWMDGWMACWLYGWQYGSWIFPFHFSIFRVVCRPRDLMMITMCSSFDCRQRGKSFNGNRTNSQDEILVVQGLD